LYKGYDLGKNFRVKQSLSTLDGDARVWGSCWADGKRLNVKPDADGLCICDHAGGVECVGVKLSVSVSVLCPFQPIKSKAKAKAFVRKTAKLPFVPRMSKLELEAEQLGPYSKPDVVTVQRHPGCSSKLAGKLLLKIADQM
jgi:hypothetical protein